MTEDQQDQLVISLDTQYAVAHAIYNRFHANGHRKHLTWENLDDDGREPWRLIAKDAITEMLASPEERHEPHRDNPPGARLPDRLDGWPGMSIIVPLHKWRSADPAILIGRRRIAQTDQDVIIDGRLELIRWPDGTASLRFQGIGNDIIDHDPNTCSNSMGDGIRSLAIYGKE